MATPKSGRSAGGKTGTPSAKVTFNPISMPLPAHTTGGKRSNTPTLIVLHSTESSNSPGTGDLRQLRQILLAQGLSVHIGTDAEGHIARFVPDNVKAFHVAAFNSISLGIEQIGHASQSSWPAAQLKATATVIAYWSQKYNIPLKHSTSKGVCRHSDLGGSGGGHSDPGSGYPFARVLQMAGQIGGVTAGGPTTSSGPTTTTTTTVVPGTGLAAAFTTFMELPGIFDQARSEMLVGNKSLMNDSPLLPFVEQLCHASLRSFQSMPNGNFFAFFPDYFGGLSHRTAYWEIDDIEILDGQIELSDDALATHVYIVGDTSPSFGTIDLTDEILSSGVVTIFDAFSSDFISGLAAVPDTPAPNPQTGPPIGTLQGGVSKIVDKTNALAFLTKYGARPYREEAPMVRNAYFELFLAYQKFMLLWSQQFLTTFTFTFMPELYPGGIVSFPDHGIQCYISDVTHECDYESGFITRANLMAPAAISGSDKKNVHDGLVRDFTLGNDLPFDPFTTPASPTPAKQPKRPTPSKSK